MGFFFFGGGGGGVGRGRGGGGGQKYFLKIIGAWHLLSPPRSSTNLPDFTAQLCVALLFDCFMFCTLLS